MQEEIASFLHKLLSLLITSVPFPGSQQEAGKESNMLPVSFSFWLYIHTRPGCSVNGIMQASKVWCMREMGTVKSKGYDKGDKRLRNQEKGLGARENAERRVSKNDDWVCVYMCMYLCVTCSASVSQLWAMGPLAVSPLSPAGTECSARLLRSTPPSSPDQNTLLFQATAAGGGGGVGWVR